MTKQSKETRTKTGRRVSHQSIKWNTIKRPPKIKITKYCDWQPLCDTSYLCHSLIQKAPTPWDLQSIHKNHSRVKASSVLVYNQNANGAHCYSIGKSHSHKTNPHSPHCWRHTRRQVVSGVQGCLFLPWPTGMKLANPDFTHPEIRPQKTGGWWEDICNLKFWK